VTTTPLDQGSGGDGSQSSASASGDGKADERRMLKNAAFLVAAQAIVTPLSIIINIVMARSLGPSEFGRLYLAMTFASLGFLFVEWGQGALLTGLVARERARAGELLASSLTWRLASSVPVTLALLFFAWAFDSEPGFTTALLLVAAASLIGSLISACQDVIRGFERTDFSAASYVGWQLLRLLVVVPTLLLGGHLNEVLAAQSVASLLGLTVVLLALAPLGVRGLQVRWRTVRELFVGGTPFLVFGLSMAAQGNVDAVFLSKLASPESVGWYAAATKLTGALIYPANVVLAAVYPTLCRLHSEDLAGYRRTAAGAVRTTVILALPVALGTFLYADLGIALFRKEAFAPAEANLQVLSVYLLFVYVSMPLGSSLVAAGRQRPWAVVQLVAVIINLALDPFLVPYFQRTWNNGGLGVCVATTVSEAIVLAAGVWLAPRGVFDRLLLAKVARVGFGGLVMVLVAKTTSGLGSMASASLAVAGYAGGLWLGGGLDVEQLATLRGLVRRRSS
jgi:O-antigen/teichoic acid export membrane protein